MSDPFSIPKLSFNLADIAIESKTPVRDMVGIEKRRLAESVSDPELHKVCRQMESLFIHHLLKEMRSTIHKTGFISGGRAEEIYTSMLDVEIAVKISERDGIGLSEMLLNQLKDLPAQEKEAKSDENQ